MLQKLGQLSTYYNLHSLSQVKQYTKKQKRNRKKDYNMMQTFNGRIRQHS